MASTRDAALFRFKVVLVLLIAAAYLAVLGVMIVGSARQTADAAGGLSAHQINDETFDPTKPLGFVFAASLGLLSSLAIAELNVGSAVVPVESRPGAAAPAGPRLGRLLVLGVVEPLPPGDQRLAVAVTLIMLYVWAGGGLATTVAAVLLQGRAPTVLTTAAIGFWGLVVGVGYAFFGLTASRQGAGAA